MISLLQLDPTPMDQDWQPRSIEKDLPLLPLDEESMEGSSVSIESISTTPVGLSGNGRGPVYLLTRIQKYSSLTFAIFATIHLANTSLIPLIVQSVPASETYLLQAREIYQTPTTEPLLVGLPIIAHVLSGVAVRLLRRSQNLKRYGGSTPGLPALRHMPTSAASLLKPSTSSQVRTWPSFGYISASGYAFAVLLWAHVGMNRMLPLKVEGDSSNIGLAYVGHGFVRHGAVAWVAFGGLIVVGCGHMVWGAAKWLGVATTTAPWTSSGSAVVDRSTRRRRRRAWWATHAVAAGLAGLWAAGGLGVVARGGLTEGWVGKLYDGIFAHIGA